MDDEATDKSVVEDLLKKSTVDDQISSIVAREATKQEEMSDEDELDKFMAGIEVFFLGKMQI